MATFSQLVKQVSSDKGTFTMVFVDVDDTLIPSTLYRYLSKTLEIDIFDLFRSTVLKELQFNIISALEEIVSTFRSLYHEEVRIAIVSNASSKWLQKTILNDKYCPVLRAYLSEKQIMVKSAIDETFAFLQKKFGDDQIDKVMEMMNISLNPTDLSDYGLKGEYFESKYMLKYTTYCSIINKYKALLHKKCSYIVNIGDGETELEAVQCYSDTFDVDYLAIKCIKKPTFAQLQYQWRYIGNKFVQILKDGVINDDDDDDDDGFEHKMQPNMSMNGTYTNSSIEETNEAAHIRSASLTPLSTLSSLQGITPHPNIFHFVYILKNDNNLQCTGTYQIKAIQIYFDEWIKQNCMRRARKTSQLDVNMTSSQVQKENDLKLLWVCTKVHQQFRGKNPYSYHAIAFKRIMNGALLKNKLFKEAFEDYYKIITKQVVRSKSSKTLKVKVKEKVKNKNHKSNAQQSKGVNRNRSASQKQSNNYY